MSATRSKWILELACLALASWAMPALSAEQVGIEFAGHVAIGRDSVALADCGSADGRHKILVEYSDFVPVEPGAGGAKACRASTGRAFEFTQVNPQASGTKSILIDEPSVSRVTLPVPNPPNASCPGGFFIATVDDGPGTGVSPGAFGMELLLDEPGTRVLAGGINFGGLVDAGQVGFAGFNFTNSANENQRFNLSLRGSPASNSAGTLQVRVKIMRSISATTSETVFDGTGDLTLAAATVAQIVVPPGFYVATVEPRGVSVGAPGGTPEGQFFFELTTSFVDRPGGGFQGGVVVGGYHATHPFGGVSGFGAFCLPTPHSASVRVVSAPTYGAGGARDLRLRILDAAQAEVVAVPGAPKTLSGEVIAVSDSYVDGDVNNPAVPNRDNDNPQQVQAIGNPAIVAGFAARTPTGQTARGDRFASSTDEFDAYRVTVTAGQTIQLVISDWSTTAPTATDLDLLVYAAGSSSAPLFTALGTDKNEFITIPTTGQYDVVVSAFAGFSNYVLAISNAPPPPATAAMLKLEDADIVPGEVIVRFDEPSPEDPRKAMLTEPGRSLKARAAQLGLEAAQGVPGRPMLFRWSGSGQIQSALQKLGAGGLKSVEASGYGLSDAQRTRWEEIALTKALRAMPEVRYAEPNWRAHLTAVPNDPLYGQQWHYPLINLPQAWDITLGNSSTIVAVLDSGVSINSDLEGNVRRDLQADLVVSTACDGNGPDLDATDPGERCVNAIAPSSFHGTHVAGTVAAMTNNSVGVAGVAGGSNIMPVRVCGGGSCSSFDVADGIRWASGFPVANLGGRVAARGADVINMSLGSSLRACANIEADAINLASSRGVLVVVAAGNDNKPIGSWALCPGVVVVGAVDRFRLPTDYTNCLTSPSIISVAAPGGQKAPDQPRNFPPSNLSACPGKTMISRPSATEQDGVFSTMMFETQSGLVSGARFYDGTSMAAPHVAGVLALMRSVFPALSFSQLSSLIVSGRMTSDDARIPGVDQFSGYGVIDAFKAVSEARTLAGGGAAPPRITVTPTELDFGETATVLPIVVGATAPGVTVNSAISSQPWLTVSGSGIGNYQAQVNRGTLPTGNYQGTITFTPSAGSPVTVNVRMRVGARATSGDVSTIYGFLLDEGGEVVAQGQLDNLQGRYPFFVTELEPGSYYFVAGSDNDNDLTICDAGESCAVYPSFANFGPIEMGSTDLNLGGFPIAPDTVGIGSNGAAAAALHDPDKSAAAARIGRGITLRRAVSAKRMEN